jgi:predicted transcriptional regulator
LDKHKPTGQTQVTTPNPHVTLSINLNKERLKTQLIYHNIFRQLKPARKKYNLSGNDLLTLNGIYIYTLLIKSEFTFTGVVKFVKYYREDRMKHYFNKLTERGFIKLHRQANTHTFYRITEEGYNLINELFNDYDSIHAKFIQEFNISL